MARAADKTVVVVKVGRTALGAIAAASHTAALAGDDAVYQALFRQHGAWRARTIEEFFDVAHCLAVSGRPVNTRVRSEEHTSELQSLMRISYAVFCLKKKKPTNNSLLTASPIVC